MFVSISIQIDRVGIAAGGDSCVVSFSVPGEAGELRTRLAELFVTIDPSELRVSLCGRPSKARQKLEAAAIAAAETFGVSVVTVSADACRQTWLGARGGSDGQMLDEADRRGFRFDDIAEIEALANFDAGLREIELAA